MSDNSDGIRCSDCGFAHDGKCVVALDKENARLRAELAALKAALKSCLSIDIDKLRAESESRLKTLFEKTEEAKREWARAEKAEAEVAALKAYIERLERAIRRAVPYMGGMPIIIEDALATKPEQEGR